MGNKDSANDIWVYVKITYEMLIIFEHIHIRPYISSQDPFNYITTL